MLFAGGAFLLLLAGGGAGWYFLQKSNDTAGDQPQGEVFTLAEGEVFLEPAAEVGPEPFAEKPMASLPDPALAEPVENPSAKIPAPAQVSIQADSGSKPGLYGGSRDDSVCDVPQLISFLNSNPQKATAWVGALNADPQLRYSGGQLSPASIDAYIKGLTPIVLLGDTRVTNHGFVNNAAKPRQSVFQKGTAVLIDEYGVPRARCYCGNPLLPPVPSKVQTTYVGPSWKGFNPSTIGVVGPAPNPQTSFKVKDPTTGSVVDKPVGSVDKFAGGATTAAADQPTSDPGQAAAPTDTAAAGQATATTSTDTASATDAPTAAPAAGQYTTAPVKDSSHGLSIPVPAGWQTTKGLIRGGPLDNGYSAGYAVEAAPDLSLMGSDKEKTQPYIKARHFRMVEPSSQSVDANELMDKSTSATQKGCPTVGAVEPYTHPKWGAGSARTLSDCTGNPSAKMRLIIIPQADGSAIQLYVNMLEDKDKGMIDKVLDELVLSAPPNLVPASIAQQCSPPTNPVPAASMTVVNNSSDILRIYWHDYDCSLSAVQRVIGPGHSTKFNDSWEGHIFSAVASDGSLAGSHTLPAGESTWTIP